MKNLIVLFVLSLVVVVSGVSQSTDSSGQERADRKNSEQRFVDENGNGIDDAKELSGKVRQRKMDRFVDKDGDGICDGREHGLGFHRGKGQRGQFPMPGDGISPGSGKKRIRGGRP